MLAFSKLNGTPMAPEDWMSFLEFFASIDQGANFMLERQPSQVNPGDLYAYNNLGVTLCVLNRTDQAIAVFKKQIEIVPNDRYAHDNLSIALAALKTTQKL